MSKTSIACIALFKDKVLVAHRNLVGQMGGRWEFPGGKVEAGETDEQAIVREFQEEFGVCVKVGDAVASAVFAHNGTDVNLHAYRIFEPHRGIFRKYKLTEHSEYKWVTFDKIKELNFVDSDMLLYPKVREYAESVKK